MSGSMWQNRQTLLRQDVDAVFGGLRMLSSLSR